MDQSRRFDLRGRSLREHAARGTIVNTAFLVAMSALGLVRGFVLAVFLTASDYGVWGILAASLGTLVWLKQVGIGDKYIQQSDPDQEVAFQKAFTLEAAFTGIFMVLLAALTPLVVLVYGHGQLLAPGLVMVMLLPANVLQAPLWVHYRNMNFVRQRLLQAIDPVLGLVAAVALAALGAGYWALAGGMLAGAYGSALAAWITSPYRLRFRYERGTLRSYASFSWPLFVGNGSSLVIAQSAILATNAKFGLAGAGALTLAATISAFTERVDGLVSGTLYPAICAVRHRIDLLHESFVKSNRLALMWAVPFGTAITLFSADLIAFGIGEKWRPALAILQVTGLTAAVGHIAFNWDAYMRAVGNTRPIAIAGVLTMLVFLGVGLPLLFAYGIEGLAYGIALQMVVHICCRAFFLRRFFRGFGFIRHALRAFLPTLPAAGMVLLVRLLETGHRGAGDALLELVLYTVVTVIATLAIEGRLLREAFGYLGSRRTAASPA